MYNIKMKKIINYALDFDIVNIETKDGYSGADVIKISSYNKKQIYLLESIAKNIAKETNIIIENKTLYNELKSDLYNLFCVFSENKIDNDIYLLKH